MKFTDCIEIVGSKPTLYEGTKQYVSTGAVEEYFINKNSIEEYTYNERPSRADLVGKSGDILFAKMAETKKTLILDKETENYLFSTGFFAIRPKSGILTTKCLYYLLNSKNFLSQKDKNSSGATQKAITNSGLEKINVNIPLFSKQDQIVKQFDLLTDIIKKYQSQLKKLDSLIKSRFIEMFGDKPVESGKWKVEKLGSHLITIDNGKSFVCSDSMRKGEYPAILKLSAVTYGEYNQNENKALLDEDMFLKKVEVKQGDLLFTRKNTPELVGMAAYVFETERNLMMPDLIFRLNVKDDLNKIYLWKLINHPLFRERIQNLANGSAKSMSNISKERLQTLKIPVPPLALQNEFSSFVQQIDKSKFAVQKSLEKAETLYKSLMQLYFA